MKLRRIAFVLLLSFMICLACSVMSGCSSSSDSKTLYVYNWGEYISDGSDDTLDVNAEFEAYCRDELGIDVKVNYSTFSSNENMYAKISSGSSSYDVIIPSDYMIQRMVSEDLLATLDISKIPNYVYVDDKFKGDNVYYEDDTDNIYSVPYFYGMIGIIYNTDIVSTEDAANESWELMWDPDYTRDILQFNNNRDAFGTALYYLGYDVNEATDEQWLEALELLKEQKKIVQGYVMDEIFNKMSNGSAAISSYYAGDFFTMYENNDSLGFYYPKEGTNSYIDAMCIPKNSKNIELAHEYINFMCRKDIAIANAEYTYYASPLTSVREDADYQEYMSEIHPDAFDILYGEKTNSVKTQAYLNLSPERLTLLNNLWEELKLESDISTGIFIWCGIILGTITVFAVYSTVKKRKRAKYYNICSNK